jgi:hypothetical protein
MSSRRSYDRTHAPVNLRTGDFLRMVVISGSGMRTILLLFSLGCFLLPCAVMLLEDLRNFGNACCTPPPPMYQGDRVSVILTERTKNMSSHSARTQTKDQD